MRTNTQKQFNLYNFKMYCFLDTEGVTARHKQILFVTLALGPYQNFNFINKYMGI